MNPQQINDDLEAMYQRRQAYAQLFNADPITQPTIESARITMPCDVCDVPFKTEWHPKWIWIASAMIASAFAAGLGYEIIRHAYRWLYSLFS